MMPVIDELRARYPHLKDYSDDELSNTIFENAVKQRGYDRAEFDDKFLGTKESFVKDSAVSLGQGIANLGAGILAAPQFVSDKLEQGIRAVLPDAILPKQREANGFMAQAQQAGLGLKGLSDSVGKQWHTDQFNRVEENVRPKFDVDAGSLENWKNGAVWQEAKGAAGFYADNPFHAWNDLVKSAPSIAVSVGAAKLGATGLSGSAATKAASGAGVVTGAMLEGGDSGLEAMQRVQEMKPEQLQALSEPYKKLIDGGATHEQAVNVIARNAGADAFAVAAAISVVASKLTGSGKLEADVATGNLNKGFVSSVGGGAVKEGAQEAVESGGSAAASNYGVYDNADKSQAIGKGVVGAAVQGSMVGAGMGSGLGLIGYATQKPQPKQAQANQPLTEKQLWGYEPKPDSRPDISGSDGTDLLGGNASASQQQQATNKTKTANQQAQSSLDEGLAQAVQNAQAMSTQNQQATAQAIQSPEVLQANASLERMMPQDQELQALAASGAPVIEIAPPESISGQNGHPLLAEQSQQAPVLSTEQAPEQNFVIGDALNKAKDTQKRVQEEAAYRQREAQLEKQKQADYIDAELQKLEQEHKAMSALQGVAPKENTALAEQLQKALDDNELKRFVHAENRQRIMESGNPKLVEAGAQEMQGVKTPELPVSINESLQPQEQIKLPPNYADERLSDTNYRNALGAVVADSTEGGNISLVPKVGTGYIGGDGKIQNQTLTRTKSTNPPITQALVSQGYQVAEIKAAIDAATTGKPLGKRYAGIVTKALDMAEGDVDEIIQENNDYQARLDADITPQALGYGDSMNAPFAPDNAQPVTLNDQAQPRGADGGVKFSRGKSNIDTDYMDAVNRGDMDTAQRLVNEYAGSRGYVNDENSNRGTHKAPTNNGYNKSLDDVSDMFGSDIYTRHAYDMFDFGNAGSRDSIRIIQRSRNNPDELVTVYRAVPKSLKATTLRVGDWVTLSKAYAVQHGKGALEGDYKIISEQVPVKNLFTDGNSVDELGFDDGRSYAYQDVKNNRKLLDAVTYDDDGNVIPLSKRFDKRNADARFSFAGRNAKTANLENLATAEQAIADGMDAEQVRQQTGWHKGTDGKWRFEIDDSGAEYDAEAIKELREVNNGVIDPLVDTLPLAGVLSHKDLFLAYPALEDVEVAFIPNGYMGIQGRGSYSPKDNAILVRDDLSDAETLSTLMHEIQHAIQEEENFARGGSPDEFSSEEASAVEVFREALRWAKEIRQLKDGEAKMADILAIDNRLAQEYRDMGMPEFIPTPEVRDLATQPYMLYPERYKNARYHELKELISVYGLDKQVTPLRAIEIYQQLAGEVEARNTQKRLGMNAQERKLTSPESTQDVPNENQIVRFDGGRSDYAPAQATLTKQSATDIISQDADGKRLLSRGKVKVFGSIDEAPDNVQDQITLSDADGNIQGFFDPATDTTYLVADALTADTIKGVLVHEVGVHAWWAKANSDKKAALEKRAMQLMNQGKRFGNEKIKAFYAGVEQRMIDADVQGNAEEAVAYIVEEAINKAGADKSKLSDSRLIDWVAKNVSQSLANFLSDFISSVRASMHSLGWLKTANLTGADLVAIAKRNMREVAKVKGVDRVSLDDGDIKLSKALETGDFGQIFTQFYHDAQGAIKHLMKVQDGEAVAALHHPDIGDIDLVWGWEGTPEKYYQNGRGLAKIVKKHSEVLGDLQGFISSLSVDVEHSGANRKILVDQSKRAIVSLDWYGKKKTWLLTAYDKDASSNNPSIGLIDGDVKGSRLNTAGNTNSTTSDNGVKFSKGGNSTPAANAPAATTTTAAAPVTPKFAIPEFTLFRKAQQKFQNNFNRIKQIQDAIIKQGGKVSPTSDVYKAEERFWGKAGSSSAQFQIDVRKLIGDISKANIDLGDMEDYLYARHAPERNEHIRNNVDANNMAGSGISDDVAEGIMLNLETKHAGIDKLADRFDAITKETRVMQYQAGLISKGTFDAWSKYKHYAPLKGFADESLEKEFANSQASIGRGFDVRGKESKTANGRTTLATALIENMYQQRLQAIVRGGKNEIGAALLNLINDNPNNDLWQIGAIVQSKGSKEGEALLRFDTAQKRDDYLANNSIKGAQLGFDGAYHTARYTAPIGLVKNAIDQGSSTVAVKIGGKEVFIKIKDDALLEQLQRAGLVSDLGMLEPIAQMQNMLKRFYTSLNPEFTAINFMRDLLTAFVAMPKETGNFTDSIKFIKNLSVIGASMRYAYRGRDANISKGNKDLIDRYLANGGSTGFMDFQDIEQLGKRVNNMWLDANKAKNANLWDKSKMLSRMAWELTGAQIEKANEGLEIATRLAAFKTAIEAGKTDREAASIAKNITVNFNRKGDYARQADVFMMFFNPAIQGTVRVAELASNPKSATMLAGLVFLGMMTVIASGDEEDDEGNKKWDLLPDENKMKTLPILGLAFDGNFGQIQMPYGVNFFTNIGYAMGDVYRYYQSNGKHGKSPEEAAEFTLKALTLHLNPFGGKQLFEGGLNTVQAVTPAMLDPLIQIGANINWAGKPMRPEDTHNKGKNDATPDSEKFFAGQENNPETKLAQWLSRTTGGDGVQSGLLEIAPSSLNAVMSATFGGVWSMGKATHTALSKAANPNEKVEWRDIPIARKMIGGVNSGMYSTAYREKADEIKGIMSQYDNYLKDGNLAQAKALRNMNSRVFDGQGSKVDSFDKQLKALRKDRNAIFSNKDLSDAQRKKLLTDNKKEVDLILMKAVKVLE